MKKEVSPPPSTKNFYSMKRERTKAKNSAIKNALKVLEGGVGETSFQEVSPTYSIILIIQ